MLTKLIIIGLATWRVTNIVVYERGPWDIFIKLREALDIEHDDEGNPIAGKPTNVLFCPYCTSVWIAGILLILPLYISQLFAVAGIAAILLKIEDRYGTS